MGLIQDVDGAGNVVVSRTPITTGYTYLHPSNAFTVWPPRHADGSTPYGAPLVHCFFIDDAHHAVWYRLDPAVGTWALVQDFGIGYTGIMVWRGVVSMWSQTFFRSYIFRNGAEVGFLTGLTVLPDGTDANHTNTTSGGADPAGTNLFTDQPITKPSTGDTFFSEWLAAPGTLPGAAGSLFDGFGTCLFNQLNLVSSAGGTNTVYTQSGIILSLASGPPMYAYLNFATDPDLLFPSIQAIGPASYDISLGWQGRVPMLVSFPQFTATSTFPPIYTLISDSSQLIPRTATGDEDPFFPAQYGPSQQYRNFMAFEDWAGPSTGSTAQPRGTFHPGYERRASLVLAKGDPEVWDRGFSAPEQFVVAASYDQKEFVWAIDGVGLLGNNYRGSTRSGQAEIQNDGSLSTFGRGRLVGTTTDVHGLWTPPVQPLNAADASAAYWDSTSIYWVTDRDPYARNLFGTTVPIREAPADPILNFGTQTPTLPPSVSPLGVVTTDSALPHFDLEQLLAACANPGLLPNPNNSDGCSPVLRAILEMSGVPFAVIREMANDDQVNGHLGGNALDVAGPTPADLGLALTDAQDQELNDLAMFITSVPELFSVAIRVNPDNDAASVYIYNGRITTAAAFPLQLRQDSTKFIHVASSTHRIAQALKDPGVRAALGVGPAVSSVVDGHLVVRGVFDLGQFGDRYVYVNQDQLLNSGKGLRGIAVSKDAPKRVNFW